MSVVERRVYGRWSDAGRASSGKRRSPGLRCFSGGLSRE